MKSVHGVGSYQKQDKLSILDKLRLFWKTCGNETKMGKLILIFHALLMDDWIKQIYKVELNKFIKTYCPANNC